MILAASTVELMLRMLVSLALIGVVALGALRLSRHRLGLGADRTGLKVHARHQLTRSAGVAVVRVGERCFLLGVTDQGVSLLAEGPDLIPAGEEPVDDVNPAAPEPVVVRGRRGRSTQVRAGSADGEPTGGAGKHQGRAVSSVSSGMSVIEALREKSVRRH